MTIGGLNGETEKAIARQNVVFEHGLLAGYWVEKEHVTLYKAKLRFHLI